MKTLTFTACSPNIFDLWPLGDIYIQPAWKRWWNLRLNPTDYSSTDFAISFWIKKIAPLTFEKKIPFYVYKLFQQIHIENKQFQIAVMQSITFHSAPAQFDSLTIFKLLKEGKKHTGQLQSQSVAPSKFNQLKLFKFIHFLPRGQSIDWKFISQKEKNSFKKN